MAALLFRKFLYTCLAMLLVISLTFILMKAIPGDPFQQEQALPTEIYEALKKHYGLNDSLSVQFRKYLFSVVKFDFGPSLVYKDRHVTEIIMTSFPTSALLGAEALLLAIFLGLSLGIIAAIRPHHWQDSMVTLIAVIGISVPSFILATLLQYVLSIKLGLLPIARWGSFSQTVLPVLSLAALPIAFIARMTRAKMVEELNQGYITTARAKGLPERIVVLRHALRNILVPLMGYIAPLTASVLTGSFIIEKIFSIPGLGYWFVTSVLNRDYPLIMGITVFYCSLLLATTFAVDILCMFIDPRLAASQRKQRGLH